MQERYDPERQRAIGRLGGLKTAATHDSAAIAANARRYAPSSVSFFYDEVDEARVLAPEERERRARAAQRLYFVRLRRRPRS